MMFLTKYYCHTCMMIARPRVKWPCSMIALFLLTLCAIIPGMIYFFVTLKMRYRVCRRCDAKSGLERVGLFWKRPERRHEPHEATTS